MAEASFVVMLASIAILIGVIGFAIGTVILERINIMIKKDIRFYSVEVEQIRKTQCPKPEIKGKTRKQKHLMDLSKYEQS